MGTFLVALVLLLFSTSTYLFIVYFPTRGPPSSGIVLEREAKPKD